MSGASDRSVPARPAGDGEEPARIAVVGGGPAGLIAAEALAAPNRAVTVFDRMPTLGRKLLMAGRSGLNLTHDEPFERFAARFGAASARLRPMLDAFTPSMARDWAQGLGIETFVGSSGRVFPVAMKASPLLRAWLARLEAGGVRLAPRHRWTGFSNDGGLAFEAPGGRVEARFDAVLLALGGASWPRLGSDAAWVPWLERAGAAVNPFRPANCGFDVGWSEPFRARFAGAPVKAVAASSPAGRIQGEFVVTRAGIEGSLVYAHAAVLRDRLEAAGEAVLTLDLVPGRTRERLARDLERQVGGGASLANRLRKGAGLSGVKAAMVREIAGQAGSLGAGDLAALLKALPVPVLSPRPICEAISVAGGVSWEAVDERLMLKVLPGTFVCGEMLDWEAPTGGYLLTACLATGLGAARGIEAWLARA